MHPDRAGEQEKYKEWKVREKFQIWLFQNAKSVKQFQENTKNKANVYESYYIIFEHKKQCEHCRMQHVYWRFRSSICRFAFLETTGVLC